MTVKAPIVEIHTIFSTPVANLNRGLDGSPKTVEIGGAIRGRISSASTNRSRRLYCTSIDPKLFCGSRSKQHALTLSEKIEALGCPSEHSANISKTALDSLTGGDTLIYLSDEELNQMSQDLLNLVKDGNWAEIYGIKPEKGQGKKAAKVKENSDAAMNEESSLEVPAKTSYVFKESFKFKSRGHNSVDIALFGRMLADAKTMNVESATSTAHSISTHPVIVEQDFFSAVDDIKSVSNESSIAGHLGFKEYMSATFYGYTCLDLNTLVKNLNGFPKEDVVTAVKIFLKSCFNALPTGNQTKMASKFDWDGGVILVRDGQACQVSWDKPVKAHEDGGYADNSVARLQKELESKSVVFGSDWGEVGREIYGQGRTRDEILDSIADLVREVI
jgi:CRISPR system Cascade subunit CasC